MPDNKDEGGDWSAARIRQVGREIREGMDNIPADQQIPYLKGRLAGLPTVVREALEPLILVTETVVEDQTQRRVRKQSQLWEKIALFVFGVVFLCVLLVLAIWFPNPTRFQGEVFCVVLGLSAAGVGAILPGFAHVEGRVKEFAIRAGGAVALFFVVYYLCRH